MTETIEKLRDARSLTIEACRITGWDGVAKRLESGWTPEPGTREADLLASYATLLDELERLQKALGEISAKDPVELALDPEWSQRIARTALQGAADV